MRRVPTVALALALLAVGCGPGDDVTAPGLRDSVSLILSDAAPASDDPTTYAYASLPLGAVPRGAEATVRNLTTGAEARGPIIDGAVDPVRLPGATGDSVELTAVDSGGAQLGFLAAIKPKVPPVVVRSSPGMRATDAPSLLRVGIVFSEPVTEASVNGSTVILTLRDQPVPGQVLLSEGGLLAEFVPEDSLVPGATYLIRVTRDVRDRSGDALAEEYAAEFTVAAAAGTRIEFAMVSAGNGYTCALTVEGAVYCWGQGAKGQLGEGTLRNRHWPAWVELPSPVRGLEAGQQTTCASTETSRLLCWGSPYSYSPENPDRTDSLYPRPAPVLGEREILRAAVGGGRMCGADRENVVWCLGVRPALEGGAILIDTTPDPHAWFSDPDMAQLSLGHFHDCYVDRSGAAWCGGNNSYGQIGTGRLGAGEEFPATPVVGGLRFSQVTTGHFHTCGLAGSTAYCWGFNSEGQLGQGTLDWAFAPVPVVGDLEWSALDAGPTYTCGVTRAGVAYCWGDNRLGQLGDGTRTRRLAPVGIGGELRFRSVSAGWDHACAVTTDAAVYCWGENASGQLGDGSTSDALSPVRVADQR
ncbi:MAG TPA: Ig-like domain-containing protein [Gemmatimonadales bacterium]